MRSHLVRASVGGAVLALSVGAALPIAAQPIELVPGTTNMFRDTRGANDVGIGQGDLFQFGADIVGGSAGLTLGAIYPGSGFAVAPFACAPLAVNASFCDRSTAFNASRLDPWQFDFARGGTTTSFTGPSVRGAEAAVPFPDSVSLSGSGTTPTISFNVPSAFTPDGFRFNVCDKGRTLPNGQADVIHSVPIAANATSYTLPSVLSSGQSLALGGNYTINFQLIDTRNDVPFSGNNAEILRRSSSFFAFTPLSGPAPGNVALPTVVDGVYNFNTGSVDPSSVTFVDPIVAVGYDYATGAGNPNFASVLLPDVGDGVFDLQFTQGGSNQSVSLADGTQFFFPQGGVSSFRVTAIEASAMLDPANVTAFVTGLTFASVGAFTGTMTPITLDVPAIPEPQTYALMLAGLGLLRPRCAGAHGLTARAASSCGPAVRGAVFFFVRRCASDA